VGRGRDHHNGRLGQGDVAEAVMNEATHQAEAFRGLGAEGLKFGQGHGHKGLVGQGFHPLAPVMIPGAALEDHHGPGGRIRGLGAEL